MPALGLSLASLALLLLWNRAVRKVPGYIVALVVGTVAAYGLGLNVDTIGTRFGGIPSGLPEFHPPTFRPGLILTLLAPAR